MLRQGLKVIDEEGFLTFIRKTMNYIYSYYLVGPIMFLVVRIFKRRLKSLSGIEGAVELAFSFKCLGISIRPMQIKWELLQFLRTIAASNPKNVLEIGTADGGTLFLLAQASSPEAVLISIDLRDFRYRGQLYKRFAKQTQQIHLIRGDSHSMDTLEKVIRILNGAKLDCLFIDADHTYEGVKKDFLMYSPLVREGGLIAFHDIVKYPSSAVYEQVNRFWMEISRCYAGREIIQSPTQESCGIGLIVKESVKDLGNFDSRPSTVNE